LTILQQIDMVENSIGWQGWWPMADNFDMAAAVL